CNRRAAIREAACRGSHERRANQRAVGKLGGSASARRRHAGCARSPWRARRTGRRRAVGEVHGSSYRDGRGELPEGGHGGAGGGGERTAAQAREAPARGGVAGE